MRRPVLLILAVGAVISAACGGGSDEPEVSDDPAVAALPDAEALADGLLTAGDMPTGWAEVPDDGGDDDPLCDIRISELLGFEDELPNAEISLAEDADIGPLVFESIGFVPEDRGPEALGAVEDAFGECEGDEVDGRVVSIGELSFPDQGDDSYAVRLTFTQPVTEATFNFDVVYMLEDDLLVLIAAADVFGDSTALLEEIAPQALEKATDVLL